MTPEIVVTAPVEQASAQAEVPVDRADTAQPPTPEQVRAAEAYFAQQQEANTVVGLLGIWTSTLLLRDLFVDHLSSAEEDEREKARRPRQKVDPESV